MTLFLVGYMGSGKSIIGRELAKVLDYKFIDFDEYIESVEQSSISHIFKTKGEIYFRKIESQHLNEVISMKEAVIALGGGTPCYGQNMSKILASETSRCIYLKSSISTLVQRLFDEKAKRPLIAHLRTKEELTEFIGKHLFERSVFYEQSHMSVKTDQLSVDEVLEALLLELF